ncbi:MAG TPA: hypothetical protein ENI63_01630 [Candidatus Kaiserbacteria bacterium]|nr:hypothetical protein [Candidatus Kaiserbacteria bacterium]
MVKKKLKEEEKKELLIIFEKNDNLHQRMMRENWNIKYNKGSDMILMGVPFIEGTFYRSVGNTGMMIRLDKDDKIHGFAIENAKFFLRENQEFIGLYPLVYPLRTKAMFAVFSFASFIRNMNPMKNLLTTEVFIRNYSQA